MDSMLLFFLFDKKIKINNVLLLFPMVWFECRTAISCFDSGKKIFHHFNEFDLEFTYILRSFVITYYVVYNFLPRIIHLEHFSEQIFRFFLFHSFWLFANHFLCFFLRKKVQRAKIMKHQNEWTITGTTVYNDD